MASSQDSRPFGLLPGRGPVTPAEAALMGLPAAICPACGRKAVDLGGNQYHCGDCGRVGLEPVTLRHYLHVDSQGGWAVDRDPAPGTELRWACLVIPGCTHDTREDAERHRREFAG